MQNWLRIQITVTNNQYIHLIKNLDINFEKIREVALKHQWEKFKFPDDQNLLHGAMRRVDDNKYMLSIKKKYPWLSNYYNIYNIPYDKNFDLHIDAGRKCALNFPIENTKNSTTIFYKFKNNNYNYENNTISEEFRSWHFDHNDVVETYRCTILHPVIFNTSVPHEVVNHNQTGYRVMLSWAVVGGLSYEDIIAVENG